MNARNYNNSSCLHGCIPVVNIAVGLFSFPVIFCLFLMSVYKYFLKERLPTLEKPIN